MKVMFCYDGSERGERALKVAVDYFKVLKPEMILLTVAEPPLDASMENEEIYKEWQAERRAELRKEAEWVAEHGLEVDVILATGEPRAMILQAIEKKSPDVVVIERKEKSEKESVFQKSISAYLVKNVGCHLFIMGPV